MKNLDIHMRLFIVPIASLLFVLLLESTGFGQTNDPRIDSLMRLYVDNQRFNGAVLVADDGDVRYRKAFGYANFEWKIPNTPETRFKIASLSKQFTALLIVQLAEEGKIKLDGHICDYIPEYPPKTGKTITLHQLLTHTSGIPTHFAIPDFEDRFYCTDVRISQRDFMALFKDMELTFTPGERFEYNNFGYFLLAVIAERVTGKTYKDLLREKIFIPAGMTGSCTEKEPGILEHLAFPYSDNYISYEPARYRNPDAVFGAGDIITTLDDFYRYDRALRAQKLVSQKYLDLINTPNSDEHYGYGWFIAPYMTRDSTRVTLAYHDGGSYGIRAEAFRFLEDDRLIVVLSNMAPTLSDAFTIARNIARILYGTKKPDYPNKSLVARFVQTTEAAGLDSALNEYRNNPLEKVQEEFDWNPIVANPQAYVYMQRGQLREAIEILKITVALYPEDSDSHDSLGEAYMKHGDKELAIASYKKALGLNPGSSNAKLMLEKLGVR